jgi:hypothetical protein
MADAQARKAAIEKASSQVRAGGVFVTSAVGRGAASGSTRVASATTKRASRAVKQPR